MNSRCAVGTKGGIVGEEDWTGEELRPTTADLIRIVKIIDTVILDTGNAAKIGMSLTPLHPASVPARKYWPPV